MNITCRLGFLVDFLSHAVIVGFMAGAAIVIGLQQLKGLLGIKYSTNKTDIISVLEAVWKSTTHNPVSCIFLTVKVKVIPNKNYFFVKVWYLQLPS